MKTISHNLRMFLEVLTIHRVCKEDFTNSQRGGSLHLGRFRAVNIDVTPAWFTVHESGRSLRVVAHNLHTSSSIRHSDFQVRPFLLGPSCRVAECPPPIQVGRACACSFPLCPASAAFSGLSRPSLLPV